MYKILSEKDKKIIKYYIYTTISFLIIGITLIIIGYNANYFIEDISLEYTVQQITIRFGLAFVLIFVCLTVYFIATKLKHIEVDVDYKYKDKSIMYILENYPLYNLFNITRIVASFTIFINFWIGLSITILFDMVDNIFIDKEVKGCLSRRKIDKIVDLFTSIPIFIYSLIYLTDISPFIIVFFAWKTIGTISFIIHKKLAYNILFPDAFLILVIFRKIISDFYFDYNYLFYNNIDTLYIVTFTISFSFVVQILIDFVIVRIKFANLTTKNVITKHSIKYLNLILLVSILVFSSIFIYFFFDPIPAKLVVKVKNTNGDPINNALVEVYRPGFHKFAYTNSFGVAKFIVDGFHTYDIKITHKDYMTIYDQFYICLHKCLHYIMLNKTVPFINLSLNTISSNITINQNEIVNITSVSNSTSLIHLYINSSEIATNKTIVHIQYNFTNYGIFNISSIVFANDNYTKRRTTLFVNVSKTVNKTYFLNLFLNSNTTDIVINQDEIVNITAVSNSTNNITLYINNIEIGKNVSKITAFVNFTTSGNYNITAIVIIPSNTTLSITLLVIVNQTDLIPNSSNTNIPFIIFLLTFVIGSTSGVGLSIIYYVRKKEEINKNDMSIIEDKMFHNKNPNKIKKWLKNKVSGSE